MNARPQRNYSKIEDIGRHLLHYCSCLTTQSFDGQDPLLTVDRIRRLLEFIPMASDEYSVAVLRVGNARRYLESNEFGAARYEVRLLLGALKYNFGQDEAGSGFSSAPMLKQDAC